MNKEDVRKFAEDLTILADDFEMNCMPVGDAISNIRYIEKCFLNKEDTNWILEWIDDEIEEYDGEFSTQYHADIAKELRETYFRLLEV